MDKKMLELEYLSIEIVFFFLRNYDFFYGENGQTKNIDKVLTWEIWERKCV